MPLGLSLHSRTLGVMHANIQCMHRCTQECVQYVISDTLRIREIRLGADCAEQA